MKAIVGFKIDPLQHSLVLILNQNQSRDNWDSHCMHLFWWNVFLIHIIICFINICVENMETLIIQALLKPICNSKKCSFRLVR
jgi:hypothetical protein